MTHAANEILTVAEMGRADMLAVEAGVPSLDLMEAAGRAVADAIAAHWSPRRVSILCGPGNNGGDGFVVARLLGEKGWPVRVGLLGDALKGDAKANADRWNGSIEELSIEVLNGAELIVDALFGAGLTRPLDGIARELVETINQNGMPCVAVDVPSGVFGDTGEVMGCAPRCALTVTFFRKKPAHLMAPGRDLCGRIVLADIGIPTSVLARIEPQTFENGPDLWRARLRLPDSDSHKYTRGHVLIVGGAEMTGAARLAARAARRVGAGMVTIAAPAQAMPIYLVGDPGQLVIELGDTTDLETLMGEKKRSAVLVGPGNGVSMSTQRHTIEALRSRAPVVVDADALSVFQDSPKDLFSWVRGPCVLTPHDGEFARLFDMDGDRLTRTRRAAATSHAVVLLKGAATVIAAPDGRAVINTATPWLATAGTGDVLAGLIVGLLAQGLPAFEATCAAAWLHGTSGAEIGPGLIAEDISERLPGILSDLFASL
ncbi:MAG: uncharacterized protein K0Q70_1813 [Rhodospirillales bacterium]|nr:uncharacterized protein [Rhodospirillales bacterium]